MDLNLSGKRAVVCGSTQGIGKAIAEELAHLGAAITLIARDEEKLVTVKEGLPPVDHGAHDYLVADFSKPEQLRNKVQPYATSTSVEILINNTGGPAPGPAIDAQTDAFEQAFKSHLICNQILAQAFTPAMKKANYGRIINIISTSVKIPIYGLGVSNTIRGAVANWSKTLSSELAPFGITVNNILPGATKTARLEAIIANKAKKSGLSVEDEVKKMQMEIPARRFAVPEEVAAAAAFLASPSAAYINGINVPVDGGRTGSL